MKISSQSFHMENTPSVGILYRRIQLNSHSHLSARFQSTLVTRPENTLEPGCRSQTTKHWITTDATPEIWGCFHPGMFYLTSIFW